MAHKKLENGMVVVDWGTGDVEGDRRYLLQAYTDFLKELLLSIEDGSKAKKVIDRWGISIENQVDEFPRIWIKRPE